MPQRRYARAATLALSLTPWAAGCHLNPVAQQAYRPQGPLPGDYAWPPKTLSEEQAQFTSRNAKTTWHTGRGTPTPTPDVGMLPVAPIAPPGGGDCLVQLDQAGVKYTSVDATRGVVTPVRVQGKLGGISYVPTGGLPLLVDCRFAVTLLRLGPLLRELGVSALHYSGAYVYRMSSKGRLSLHANGLAIDIHEITVDGKTLSIEESFARGLGDGCSNNAPPLNRVACHLQRSGAFKEFLTPDYDADHHDHLHLAIAPTAQP